MTAAPCLGYNHSYHPSVSLCHSCPDYRAFLGESVYLCHREHFCFLPLCVIAGMSCVWEGWQLFQALLSAAFVAYPPPPCGCIPSSGLNSKLGKAWDVERGDEALDRLSEKAGNPYS